MKKMMAFATLSMLALSRPAFAQMGHGPEIEGFEHGHMMMLLKAAQLTQEQKAQSHEIMKATHQQVRPLMHQVKALREQIADKIAGSGSVQLSDIAPLRQQIRDLQVQIDDLALGGVLKVRALLRPDQLQHVSETHLKLKSLHSQMDELSGPPDEGPEARPVGY